MGHREFFDKVSEMRHLQKEYFRTRSSLVLKQCKSLEKEVDAEIERVNKIINKPTVQMELFNS